MFAANWKRIALTFTHQSNFNTIWILTWGGGGSLELEGGGGEGAGTGGLESHEFWKGIHKTFANPPLKSGTNILH